MRMLIYESPQSSTVSTSVGAPPTLTLATPSFRPRTPPQGGVLLGAAMGAKPGDSVQVAFTLRFGTLPTGFAGLSAMRALLIVRQAALSGNDPEAVYPSVVTDVSSALHADGRITADIRALGVTSVELRLSPYTSPPANVQLFALTQVFADEQAITVQPLPEKSKGWPHD